MSNPFSSEGRQYRADLKISIGLRLGVSWCIFADNRGRYYLLYSNSDGTAPKYFPEGFQMIAGDNFRRNFSGPVPDLPKSDWAAIPGYTSQESLAEKAIGFNCLNYAKAAEGSLYRHFLPDKAYLDANCADGVRFELMFPSCWNGKDVDSPDHKSHVAYPSLVMTGDCPSGYETRLVSLFYETIWNTAAFVGQDGEFVISNGDPTGKPNFDFAHSSFVTDSA